MAFGQIAQAQIEFQEHNIDNTNCIYRVFPSDVNGDGRIDFFAICNGDNTRNILWYENLDGLGNFVPRDPMPTDGEAATRLYPIDIDGDGDMDLVSASIGADKKIFWFENANGQGLFINRQIIGLSSLTPWAISAADIDGDGDVDVVASFPGSRISWYENTDGQGAFAPEQVVSNSNALVYDMAITDLDADGDQDLLVASEDENEIAWYPNDGTGSFGDKEIISSEVSSPNRVYATDIDNDGDPDVLSSSLYDGKIAWYENTNGMGVFSDQNLIIIGESGVQDLATSDLDGDGDLDVCSTSRFGTETKVAWYENLDGAGNFGDQQILSTDLEVPSSIHSADFDGDLDMDLILCSGFSNTNSATSYWYENLSPVKTTEQRLFDFTISPTLVEDFLKIASAREIVSIEIHNTLGQLVLTKRYPTMLNISELDEGLYFCVVKDKDGRFGTKTIVKKTRRK